MSGLSLPTRGGHLCTRVSAALLVWKAGYCRFGSRGRASLENDNHA
jgi:hypothetical protein